LNLYAYADQNPQSFIDRNGENPVAVALALGLIEAGLTIWDIYETGSTLMDPCASLGDKALSGGGLMMGAVLPGGGYGAGGKAGKKALGAGKKAPKGPADWSCPGFVDIYALAEQGDHDAEIPSPVRPRIPTKPVGGGL
jgi:hypothetical protein